MIEFVLEDSGQPALRLDPYRPAVEVVTLEQGPLCSGQRVAQTGQREAALLVRLTPKAVPPGPTESKPGVHDQPLAGSVIAVIAPDKQLQGLAHLWCRETHTGRSCHRLHHVLSQLANLVGDGVDGLGPVMNDCGVGGEDGEDTHTVRLPGRA